MKIPLTFQITEFDCGTTSLLNALLFLFDREEIPVSLLKAIYAYTLDAKGENGIIGEAGTSRTALANLINWITDYVYNYCVEAIEERTTASIKLGLEKFPNYLNWGKKI